MSMNIAESNHPDQERDERTIGISVRGILNKMQLDDFVALTMDLQQQGVLDLGTDISAETSDAIRSKVGNLLAAPELLTKLTDDMEGIRERIVELVVKQQRGELSDDNEITAAERLITTLNNHGMNFDGTPKARKGRGGPSERYMQDLTEKKASDAARSAGQEGPSALQKLFRGQIERNNR
ncbi:hypothetical protein JKY72_05205 [Candidatus Gracilibacteria bacterium]|nr:hypothetical protein [Candidatus Gracilibacteria bacterium]